MAEQVGDPSKPWVVGGSVELHSHAIMDRYARYPWVNQDLNSAKETKREYRIAVAELNAAKDGPAGTYEIKLKEPGNYSIFADKAIPLSLYAPEGFIAESMNPPVKTYFRVPQGVQEPKVFFQKGAFLFTPDGEAFKDAQQLTGWITLPQDKPGLWSFESIDPGKVQTENLPGFFAMGDPAFYMEHK